MPQHFKKKIEQIIVEMTSTAIPYTPFVVIPPPPPSPLLKGEQVIETTTSIIQVYKSTYMANFSPDEKRCIMDQLHREMGGK